MRIVLHDIVVEVILILRGSLIFSNLSKPYDPANNDLPKQNRYDAHSAILIENSATCYIVDRSCKKLEASCNVKNEHREKEV